MRDGWDACWAHLAREMWFILLLALFAGVFIGKPIWDACHEGTAARALVLELVR